MAKFAKKKWGYINLAKDDGALKLMFALTFWNKQKKL